MHWMSGLVSAMLIISSKPMCLNRIGKIG